MNENTPEDDMVDEEVEFDADFEGPLLVEPPHPINWNLLGPEDLEAEWLELNRWVHWLRRTYGLSAAVIPPFWHHHPELLWELSALHLHWLCCFDAEKSGSAPLTWHRDFADVRLRLRDWVATNGTRLDRDRSTRQTAWPGEAPAPQVEDVVIDDRETEFIEFVLAEVEKRREEEDQFYRSLDPRTGEIS